MRKAGRDDGSHEISGGLKMQQRCFKFGGKFFYADVYLQHMGTPPWGGTARVVQVHPNSKMQNITNEKDEIVDFDAGSEQQVVESVEGYLRKHFGDGGEVSCDQLPPKPWTTGTAGGDQ